MISIKKCLEIMHSGAVFSLRVVQYDKRRKDKRGAVLYLPEAQLVWGEASPPGPLSDGEGERPMTDLEKKLAGIGEDSPPYPPEGGTIPRNPNHAWHYTRNVRQLVNGQPTADIKKIHPPLIIEFNGQPTTA